MTIKELTSLLQAIKIDYAEQYKVAMAERDKALKEVEANFKPDAPFYKARIKEINEAFDKTIADKRIESMDSAMTYIIDIRETEIEKAKKIDTAALEKILALKDIPLSKSEILAIKDRYGAKDYYSGRMLAVIAEKNGIELSEVGIEAPLDTKLGVLSALEKQMDIVIRDWSPDAKETDKREKHVIAIAALGEETLRTFEQRWTNDYSDGSDSDVANKAYLRIKAAESQSEKAILISNALRNAKGEARNLLLYKLALDSDSNISEYAFGLSGHSEEIAEWKSGKAESYASAVKLVEDIAPIRDLSVVMQRIEEHSDNPFLDSMLKEAAKDSETIRTAISDSFAE